MGGGGREGIPADRWGGREGRGTLNAARNLIFFGSAGRTPPHARGPHQNPHCYYLAVLVGIVQCFSFFHIALRNNNSHNLHVFQLPTAIKFAELQMFGVYGNVIVLIWASARCVFYLNYKT
jgi:hypothetical protein